MSSATDVLSNSMTTFAGQAVRSDLADRIVLCRECIRRVGDLAFEWAAAAAHHKSGGRVDFTLTEDLLSGPAVVLRQLQLTIQTLESILKTGTPALSHLPERTQADQLRIQVVPTRGLFDSLAFNGIAASVIFHRDVCPTEIHGTRIELARDATFGKTAVVLGAGNVSAIPATDCLNKIMFEGYRVVLKMNPVNDYLGPIFERAFEPLVHRGLLKIVRGGADVGEAIVQHPAIDAVHITGATGTHDAIVWGIDERERAARKVRNEPRLQKSITSELGNVSPWIVIPGTYTDRQLASQAEHIAASITNNASFNCLATKVIVTWAKWPQRLRFLELIQRFLTATPVRYAYYPGAVQRFREFAGSVPAEVPDGYLPWTLLIDQSPTERPELFAKESFVAICAETRLDAESPEHFLRAAVDFVNHRVCGTLCASLTVPHAFRKTARHDLLDAVSKLQYGTVCINQWSGLSYALISTPWGAWPGATLQNPQSGMGNVHNTYLLDAIEKTLLDGPLISFPKPVWFPSHRRALAVATSLVRLYSSPSILRLPGLGLAAAFG